MSLVSLVKTREHAENSLKQAITESLNLIEYSFKKELKNIVIKPNLCYYWDYSTGQTTDPKFVAALINVIRQKIPHNVDISIIESDASAMKCKHAFKMLGYEKLSQECNVSLVNLSEDNNAPINIKTGGQSFHLMMPQTIQQSDLKINVPKIKYAEEKIKITCALKNIFGCNPYPKKFRYHPKLNEVIVALNKAMRFDLCIVDGIIVSGIHPRKLGLVMASRDPVALDVAAAKITGENYKRIPYIRLAHQEGLGNTAFIPRGESIRYFKARYPKKDIGMKLRYKAYDLLVRTGFSKKLGL